MKIIKIQGGLGNQLFQYSFGVFLEKQYKEKILYETSFFKNDSNRVLELNNLVNYRELKLNYLTKLFIYLLGLKYTQKNQFDYFSNFKNKISNLYFDGYWQNINFTDSIKNILEDKIKFKYDKQTNYESEIRNNNSVSIHIRLTDYINNISVGNICDKKYYSEAIRKMSEKLSNPIFFIFSDDIDLAKEQLPKQSNIVFIENNYINNTDSYYLYLMSLCKHNIIANSTFSWWGAYLNKNKEKIVIAPSKWHSDYENINLIPKTWIKI